MTLPDHYATLEVANDASLEDIKQAYRRLARLYHPDINKEIEDVRIKRLNEAYFVLGDVTRRTLYDIQRLEQQKRDVIIDFIIQQREQARREARMTWKEGARGFVQELKKEMRNE